MYSTSNCILGVERYVHSSSNLPIEKLKWHAKYICIYMSTFLNGVFSNYNISFTEFTPLLTSRFRPLIPKRS